MGRKKLFRIAFGCLGVIAWVIGIVLFVFQAFPLPPHSFAWYMWVGISFSCLGLGWFFAQQAFSALRGRLPVRSDE